VSLSAPAPNKWLITIAVSSGTFMGALDASIVYVALPQIRGSLGATLQESTWANTSFIIATAVVLPLTGFLSRRLGQKRTYLASLALFIVSSLLCGACRSMSALAMCRALQGAAVGILTPTEQAILQRIFPPHQRGMAMAIFTMVIVVGPAVGPLLGGTLVNHFSWPWIFVINVPIGVIGFAMVWHLLDEPKRSGVALRDSASLDWLGLALLAFSLAAFQYVLEDGLVEDWFESSKIVGFALIATACAVGFVVRSQRVQTPVIELSLFREPVFCSGAMLGAIAYLVVSANLFLLPVFLQEVLGFTPLQAGAALVPRALAMIIAIPIVGALYGRVPTRALVVLGLAIKAAGVYALADLDLSTGLPALILPLALQGLGASLIFVPLNAAVFTHVPADRVADAAGVNLMMRHLGSSIGLALVATLLSLHVAQARDAVAANLTVERQEVRERLGQSSIGLTAAGLEPAEGEEASLLLLASTVRRQSTVLAVRRLFAQAALVLLLAVPFLFFVRDGATARQRAARSGGEA
jgi:MFS transporter, DHA2 family, multidrug resistance protein